MTTFEKISRCPLFAGIAENELKSLLVCLKAVKRSFSRDELIFVAGDRATAVGIVLSGGVRVVQEDFWGHRAILAHVEPSGLFGEAFSCAEDTVLPVSVIAAEACEILLVDYRKIVTTCSSACGFHTRLVMNMLRIVAHKNILLTQKIEHLSKRTTREKMLSFLSAQAVAAKSTVVEIPFNKTELAEYLCVNRSALSRELSAMQEEGLLQNTKNHFELFQMEPRL